MRRKFYWLLFSKHIQPKFPHLFLLQGLVVEDDGTDGEDRVRDLRAEIAKRTAVRVASVKEAEAAQEVCIALCCAVLRCAVL